MSFLPIRPYYIGIESDAASTKAAVLRKSRSGWEITEVKEAPNREHVNPLDMLPKDSFIATAITSQEILVRSCEMQLKKKKDLLAALDFHIEPLLPYPSERAIIQGQILKQHEHGTSLTAFAVRKDHLQAHLVKIRPLVPDRVTCVPFALAAFSSLLPPSSTPILIVHANQSEIACALVENGKLLASRAFGKEQDIKKEIHKTVLSFTSVLKEKSLFTIILLGSDASLSDVIQEATGIPVLFPYIPSLKLSQEDLTRFGLAIGIAIADEEINFLQKEFASSRTSSRLKKPLLITCVLMALLTCSVFFYESFTLTSKKKMAQQALASLFSAEGKTKEAGMLPKTSYGCLSHLSDLEKAVRSRPDTFPLFPLVPKVQDVIAWITSQPQFAGKEGALISIDSLHYALTKRPDFSNKNEHYKVKIDLEFSAKNPAIARVFQETLSSPNPIVDSKEEIQWTAGKGKYRAVFYLQDKTRYS